VVGAGARSIPQYWGYFPKKKSPKSSEKKRIKEETANPDKGPKPMTPIFAQAFSKGLILPLWKRGLGGFSAH
jgi:hypothetical protein